MHSNMLFVLGISLLAVLARPIEAKGLETWIEKYIENHNANPIYNAAHELNPCEKGLQGVHFNRDDFTYIAVAKAATREIHNQLCQRLGAKEALHLKGWQLMKVFPDRQGLKGHTTFV